ncbi:hypothetical protein [Salinispira pacifica]|uniref:Uncharacterized protein n=1 Tax=Salinispira pacifica TaxID=1307761 RepID=V5WFY7_9SPIO|nr:hypothetical protein [Salinispira pacifica]AHC14747.1 hypothetical protein L21SP2_1348 [Salinispira pacifica]
MNPLHQPIIAAEPSERLPVPAQPARTGGAAVSRHYANVITGPAPVLRIGLFLCLVFFGMPAAVSSQEEALNAPESTSLVLPDVIVDLPEPDYGDVQTLLPGDQGEEYSYRALPRPRQLADPGLPSNGGEPAAGDGEDSGRGGENPAPRIQFGLGGGYAPGMNGYVQLFDPRGSYLLAADHTQSWGDFSRGYTPPDQGFALSRSRITGRIEPFHLLADYQFRGLGALESYRAQHLLDAEAGVEWGIAGFSGEFNSGQDLRRIVPAVEAEGDIPNIFLRFSADSSNRYRKEWERSVLEFPLNYRLELSPQYGLWHDLSLGAEFRHAAGELWSFDLGYIPGISRGPGAGEPELNDETGDAPGFSYSRPGYRGINHNFHLGLGFNGEKWGHDFRGGFEQLRPDETELWRTHPLLSPFYVIPESSGEIGDIQAAADAAAQIVPGAAQNRPLIRRWFFSTLSEFALTDDLLLSGGVDTYYYYERPVAGDWSQAVTFGDDGREFRNWYASRGLNFVTTLGFRGLFSENIFGGVTWVGNFLLNDGLQPSQQLEAEAEIQNQNDLLSAGVRMELNLFRSLQPPLFSIIGGWNISPLWALSLEISDPVAAFLSRGRFLHDSGVSPIQTRGFTVDLFVEYRNSK